MIDWHFDRGDLAKHFLSAFETGITGSLTLFAPRRMGKSEFLLLDLAPLAHQKKYNICYCSFWQLKDNPAKALRHALEEALENQDWRQRLSGYITPSTTLELKGELPGMTVALKKSGPERPTEDDLLAIIDLIRQLSRKRRPSLLLLDEVQHLSTRPEFESLVATLRTEFETHRKKVHVVFTGSSRDGLMRMFRDRKAPMFHASQQIDLPELGSDFVAYMLQCFEQASKVRLSLAAAVRVFSDLQKGPALFHHLLKFMLIQGISDISKGYEVFSQVIDIEEDYESVWRELLPVDQAVLQLLAGNLSIGLYTEAARHWLGEKLGVDEVSVPRIQNAIDRLRDEQLIYSAGHSRWAFEDTAFREWVSDHSPADGK